jgi:2'-5' RNA ligase
MTSGEPATSLWLVPAEPHRAELRGHIDRLALEHGTPTFEPHVTLASGVADHAPVLAAIERVASAWAPLEVVAGTTAHGPDRFKAVFVELEDVRLHDLAAALCGELGIPFAPEELHPHISLVYAAGLPAEVRAVIGAEHAFAGRTLRFDTLTASVPGTDIDDVPRWQLPVVRPLSGARELLPADTRTAG